MLEVSYRQHTFGNFILFCKRIGVEKISELYDEELLEMRNVLQEIEAALSLNDLFRPIRFNYWQMGNKVHALHIHGIPRYDSDRLFLNKVWRDADFHLPPCWTYELQPVEIVAAIREAIKKYLR